jgi:cell division protein FtsL
MSQVAYNPYQAYDSRCFQPTDRFYVRSSVFLPSGDVDPMTGLLKRDARRRGRTQALRMEAHRLDMDYDKLNAAVQARKKEKGIHIPLRYAVTLILGVALLCAVILLVQQGTLLQRQRNLQAEKQRIETIQVQNEDLRAKITDASDAATICYAASQDLDMVPASSTQAIHLTAVDTRPQDSQARVSASAGSQATGETLPSAGE